MNDPRKDAEPTRMGWHINMKERMGVCRGPGPMNGPHPMHHRSETHALHGYATAELQSLFSEWLAQLESEVLAFAKNRSVISLDDVVAEFSLSAESAAFILSKLAESQEIEVDGLAAQTGGTR